MKTALNIDEVSNLLTAHRNELSWVISTMDLPETGGCKSFLFLMKIKGILSPCLALYNLLLQKGILGELRENSLFPLEDHKDILKRKLNSHDYVFFERTMAWFEISFRDFIFVLGHTDDYQKLFGDWSVRVSHKSHYTLVKHIFNDVMHFLGNMCSAYRMEHKKYPDDHFVSSCLFEFVTDKYFRNSIKSKTNWSNLCSSLDALEVVLNQYAESYLTFSSLCASVKDRDLLSSKVRKIIDYFQIYEFHEFEDESFSNCGIEIEFQAPKEMGDLEGVGEYLEQIFKDIGLETTVNYSAPIAYKNKFCVIAVDESLPRFEQFSPAEYSSSIITSQADYKEVEKVIECLNAKHCQVDSSAGLHIHVSKEKMDIPSLKRLIIRYAKCEHIIRKYFYNYDRESDYNLYSPSIFSNFYGDGDRKDRTKSLLLLAHFVHHAQSEKEAYDAASAACRYTGLYTYTKFNTVEFRGHPATLSDERIKNYFDFVQKFVSSSMQNSTSIFDRKYLKHALNMRSQDKTSIKSDPLQVRYKYNLYTFNPWTELQVYKNIYDLNIRVSDEIIRTGKLSDPLPLKDIASGGDQHIQFTA